MSPMSRVPPHSVIAAFASSVARRRLLAVGLSCLACGALIIGFDSGFSQFAPRGELASLGAALLYFSHALTVTLAITGASMLTMSLFTPGRIGVAIVCGSWAALDFLCALTSDPLGRMWLIGRFPQWFERTWLLPLEGQGLVHFGNPGARLFIAAAAALIAYLAISNVLKLEGSRR